MIISKSGSNVEVPTALGTPPPVKVVRIGVTARDDDVRLTTLHPAVRARIRQWKANIYTTRLRNRLRIYGFSLRLQFLDLLSFACDAALVLLKARRRFSRWYGHENS